MPIRNRFAELHDEITAWRRDFHEHPEILYEVHRTAGIVADKLREFFQAKDMNEADWDLAPDFFAEQVMAGQNVAIPLSTDATKITGTDGAEWVKANAVMGPDELSAADAQAFKDEVQDILEQARQEVEDAEASERTLRAADVQIFDEVFVLTGGGPGSATTFIVQFIYQTGFAEQIHLYGLAAAASLVLALGLVLLTLVQLRLTRASDAGQKAR